MKIKKLEFTGLYGYMNKTIDFNDDLSILVGINGSGKTSILNLISWMVNPSLGFLCITEFSKIKLWFFFRQGEYVAECIKMNSTLKYSLLNSSSSEKFHPLTVSLDFNHKDFPNDEISRDRVLQHYANLSPDKKEERTWAFLKSLPSPTIVGLDRNLYTEEFENNLHGDFIELPIYKKSKKQRNLPIEKVKNIVNKEYRKKKNIILNLTNDLKNHLMLSTFEGSISIESMWKKANNPLTLNQIDHAEQRVKDYFSRFEKSVFNDKEQSIIKAYFEQLKSITQKFINDPNDQITQLLFSLNSKQFTKLKRIINQFEKFEKEAEETLKTINLYLDTLNKFFKDSSKTLTFKDDTFELTFNTLDKNGKTTKEHNDISKLSSGEQQILILFSYLAFNSQDGRLFIIDEPELSLHIKWQEDFLEALEAITPKNTQIVLATHSPIIVGKKKQKAILLLPYNE